MSWNQNWQRNPWYAGQSEASSTPLQSQTAVGAPMASTGPGTVQQPTIGGVPSESTSVESATRYAPPAVPLVDIVDSPDELTVYVDTPGFEEEHLSLHADGNTLHLSGDRHEDLLADESDEQFLLTERPLRVERSIPLPMEIDPDQVVARHENGVCHITIPKDEREQRHEIAFQ